MFDKASDDSARRAQAAVVDNPMTSVLMAVPENWCRAVRPVLALESRACHYSCQCNGKVRAKSSGFIDHAAAGCGRVLDAAMLPSDATVPRRNSEGRNMQPVPLATMQSGTRSQATPMIELSDVAVLLFIPTGHHGRNPKVVMLNLSNVLLDLGGKGRRRYCAGLVRR